MFSSPFELGDLYSVDTAYFVMYYLLVLMGVIHMYKAFNGQISAKVPVNMNYLERNSFYVVDAWIIEHLVFIVAFLLAVVYGQTEIGRFASVLLLCDMVISYAFIPTQTIRSHHCVLAKDVAKNILWNVFIAVFLSYYNVYKTQDVHLTALEKFNVALGIALYFFGMMKRVANYKLVQNFPYNNDPRIMGAPDFEYVTSPDYFGELLQALGFHIICGNPASMGYALYKAQVAIGNAFLRDDWYRKNNSQYPAKRAIIVPHLF